MNASKENARQARSDLTTIQRNMPPVHDATPALCRLADFLKAAERKLPSEEAYASDAERRKAPKK